MVNCFKKKKMFTQTHIIPASVSSTLEEDADKLGPSIVYVFPLPVYEKST